jgi:endonuclease I
MNNLKQFMLQFATTLFTSKVRSIAFGALLFCTTYHSSIAQAPAGYYSAAQGLTGNALQLALHNIIKNHTALSYTAVWNAYYFTDDKQPGNICWDMYSDYPQGTPAYVYTLGTHQCSSTPGYEGVCYNREHSFPKSWFGGEIDPMYTDLFHLVPTDSYVNSRRSNYPYGTVSSPTWVSTNGSKLGPCSFPGYSGIVFEPNPTYKGDLARNVLYMAVRYADVIASWENLDINGDAVLDGTQYPAFEPWAIQLLLQWHLSDPVDQKEIDRNNEIYLRNQGNRNPFIDNPSYASLIWSSFLPTTVSVSTIEATAIGTTTAVSGGTLSNTSGAAIIAKGVCWATFPNPSLNNQYTNEGTGIGDFTSTLSGLSSGTTYYVRAYISTTSGTTYGYAQTFTTTCGSFSIPYSETFSIIGIPPCWSQIDYIGNGQIWKFGIITNQSPNPALDGYYAYLNSAAYGFGNTQNADLISPLFDLTGFTDVTLSFDYFFRYYTGSSCKVYYSLNNGGSWILLAQFTSLSATNPSTFSQLIPALAGQSQVRFKWNYTGTFGFYWAIDDVSLNGTTANTLAVTPSSQGVTSMAGMANYTISTNASWTASSNAAWCAPTTSGNGSAVLTTNYTENLSVNTRNANITIIVPGVSPVVVSLQQDGASPYLTASPNSQTVAPSAVSASFVIQSNTSWTASSNQSWCTVTSSGASSGLLQAGIQQNIGPSRTALITIQPTGAAPVTVELIQAAPEPTADPSDFSAHTIILSWDDATGTVLPVGYLIKASSVGFEQIQLPTDGLVETDDTLRQNILYGINQAVFRGLQPSTIYYFKVFPFNGTGNQIRYKTDGVSQVQLTTGPE